MTAHTLSFWRVSRAPSGSKSPRYPHQQKSKTPHVGIHIVHPHISEKSSSVSQVSAVLSVVPVIVSPVTDLRSGPKKVSQESRHSVEDLYQALFFVSPFPRERSTNETKIEPDRRLPVTEAYHKTFSPRDLLVLKRGNRGSEDENDRKRARNQSCNLIGL